jgi:hypothetical protein
MTTETIDEDALRSTARLIKAALVSASAAGAPLQVIDALLEALRQMPARAIEQE